MFDGHITLIDEILTPDSSRYWDAETYKPGSSPASFDKQYVRDFLVQSGWNKEPPAPALPPEVVKGTSERYREAYNASSGRTSREICRARARAAESRGPRSAGRSGAHGASFARP